MTFTLNVCLRGLLNCRKLMFVFVAFWTAGKEYTKRRWTGGTNICSLITNIYSVHKMPCWPCNNFRYFWPILIKNKYCRAYRLGRDTCIIRRKSCLKSILYKIMSYYDSITIMWYETEWYDSLYNIHIEPYDTIQYCITWS